MNDSERYPVFSLLDDLDSVVNRSENAEITAVVPIREALPSVTVVKAVAQAEETDPSDLPLLYDAVEPDALDRIFGDGRAGRVAFEYCGYTVAVQDHDVVVLR